MMTFDYAASAELFMPNVKVARVRRSVIVALPPQQRQFRFAVEELPAIRTLGAWMQVGEERFNGDDIRRLYESTSYPRRRRLRKSG